MRRGPEDPRPRSWLATSASRAPEQLRLAYPRSVVAGKARCRPTLDALSAPMRGGSRKAPARPCIDDPAIRSDRPLPQGALRRRRRPTAADMRPLPSASPASITDASPRPTIRRQALLSRVGEGLAKPSTMVRCTCGRRSRPEQSGSADTRRREPLALCGQPAGHFRPAVPRFCGPGQDGRL